MTGDPLMNTKRLSVAIAAYGVLAVFAMIGLGGDVRTGTLIVLGGLAAKTLIAFKAANSASGK